MPKLANPPQGGEKYLCLTLFATMAASVVSAVICIYCIVIIYKPSLEVLDSKIGKKCPKISFTVPTIRHIRHCIQMF